MKPQTDFWTRRRFLQTSAVVAGSIRTANATHDPNPALLASETSFALQQQKRRKELWGLLGDLPWQHKPGPARLIGKEDHDGYTLERLVLDLNGVEPVPALLLIPTKRQPRAPGLLYIHWHGGMYDLGKEQLLKGVPAQPAYAPVCAEKGIVTLAIDSWCFGERKHVADGGQGEQDAFKLMLWYGQVLYGMMMFDEFRAMDYLASRPEIDNDRLGVLGMSMGSTKAWWLAALDPRVKVCMDVCCLTDYESLIQAHGLKEHGIYYYVPSLLKHFQTADINELIVPRAHLSVNGQLDPLTPSAGVDKIRNRLLPLYREHGSEADCRIELFNCAHFELPEMRKLIVGWMDRHLVADRAESH
ncbi:MAG TPA: alpha/beta hydrolase family protein [Candidatus Acidoferrum sp.]|jgi:dienelactone hydrolase|nr:alpha/beta hydrolase family protein [Candidatus Acidoferrum sp.]